MAFKTMFPRLKKHPILGTYGLEVPTAATIRKLSINTNEPTNNINLQNANMP